MPQPNYGTAASRTSASVAEEEITETTRLLTNSLYLARRAEDIGKNFVLFVFCFSLL
jgi:hypothetical protein